MGENLAEPQLRSLANSEIISERRDQALNELAVLGDFDAQHTLLERIRAALEENPHSFERDGPHWLGVVTSADLAELLGSILRAAHGASETSLLSRQVEAAIRNIADPRCIAVYDGLIEAPDLRAPQFFWYQHQALVRHMVRLQVLARLEELGEAAIDALLFGARS